jgi:pyridoxal phosphate enzyme (YggS family)
MVSPDPVECLQRNVARVRATIAEASGRVGRDPRSVCLVAVTKYIEPPLIRALLAAGVCELGENRVQQLVARAAQLGARPAPWPDPSPAPPAASRDRPPTPRWHMIGHVQRNKVKALLPGARILHAVDSVRLATEVDQVAARLNLSVDALLEVNVSGEASKFGVAPAELARMAAAVQEYPRIRLRGLMTVTPLDPDPEHGRPYFRRLHELLEQLRQTGTVGPECVHLSMGMSQDYAVAVEEGATLVRIGSALYEGLQTDGLKTGP